MKCGLETPALTPGLVHSTLGVMFSLLDRLWINCNRSPGDLLKEEVIKILLKRYRTVLERIDAAFDQAREDQPDAIPCYAGCSRCCYALFAVRPIDAALITEGLQTKVSRDDREEILENCRNVFTTVQSEDPEITPGFRVHQIGRSAFDRLVETVRLPCPFLTREGWCGVYAYRPRICRLAGAIFKDVATGDELEDYCPLGESAREKHGFCPVAFDLSTMYATMMEFDEACLRAAPVGLQSGYTFPAAGVLEWVPFFESTRDNSSGAP